MSDLDELTDEDIWAMPITTETFQRKAHLIGEVGEYLAREVRRLRRRLERQSHKLRKIAEEMEAGNEV